MSSRAKFKFAILIAVGMISHGVTPADEIVWQSLPEIYPGELSSLRVQLPAPTELHRVTVVVSNSTVPVSVAGVLPFGGERLCGEFASSVIVVGTQPPPQSAFSTAGTYFITVEMSSRTNYFRQVVRDFQNQADEQAFQNLPAGLILKTILLGGAVECTTTDVQAVQSFLTAFPNSYYATYARTYLASCALYTELAGNRAEPFRVPDPSAAIANLETIQGAQGLCRGKILFDLGFGRWRNKDFTRAKAMLRTLINEYPATTWASAAKELLGLKLDEIVAWYPLDEGMGTTTTNLVCNGPSGQLTGSSLPTWVSGIESNGLAFDGAAAYVDAPTNAILDAVTNALTISLWVNTTNAAPRAAVSYRAREYDSGWRLFYGTTNIVFQWTTTGGVFRELRVYGTFPSNQWAHLAAVFQPPNAYVYLNGACLATNTNAGSNLWLTAAHSLKIGRCDSGNPYWFPGKIDDVRIYGRALSGEDITDIYNMDSDADGLSNAQELNVHRTDPGRADTDGDGLTDGDEVVIHLTSPNSSDTDGDGVSDYDEIWNRGTNPNDPASRNITLYADSVIGNNAYDGAAPTVTGGHGPKKNISAAISVAISGDSVQIAGDQTGYAESTFDPGGKTLTLRPTGTVTILP